MVIHCSLAANLTFFVTPEGTCVFILSPGLQIMQPVLGRRSPQADAAASARDRLRKRRREVFYTGWEECPWPLVKYQNWPRPQAPSTQEGSQYGGRVHCAPCRGWGDQGGRETSCGVAVSSRTGSGPRSSQGSQGCFLPPQFYMKTN